MYVITMAANQFRHCASCLCVIILVIVMMRIGAAAGAMLVPQADAIKAFEPLTNFIHDAVVATYAAQVPPLVETPFLSQESDESLARLYSQPFRGRNLFALRHSLHDVLSWRAAIRSKHPRRRASSCAVVGSSGSLLDARAGASIDENEWVIRANGAPTSAALSAHVGRRTTFYVNAYLPSRGRMPEAHARATPNIFFCQNMWVAECWTRTKIDGAERLSPWLVDYAARLLRTAKAPTTGFMAIVLALHCCNLTRLYGFGEGAVGSGGSGGGGSGGSVARAKGRGCARYFGRCENASAYKEGGRQWHDWSREAAWIRASGLLAS